MKYTYKCIYYRCVFFIEMKKKLYDFSVSNLGTYYTDYENKLTVLCFDINC